MSLDQKYDAFYKGDGQRKVFDDVDSQRWPRNRIEAIVHEAGSGERVLDIGCGDGFLLYQMRAKFKSLVGIE